MTLSDISFVFVIIMIGTSVFLLINRRWSWSIGALAIQYFAVFWLVSLVWSLGLAAVKLVVGWMVCAVLVVNPPTLEVKEKDVNTRSWILLRLLVSILIIMVVFSTASRIADLVQTGMVLVWGSMILIGMGILQLGMTTRPYQVILGLLTTLSGFEVIYASVENSILVAGFLTLINLGLALIGPYLQLAASREESS